MTSKERVERCRARKRGEDVPKVRAGPKLGYRQTDAHIAKRMKREVVASALPRETKRGNNAVTDARRESVLVDMEASPELEEPKNEKVEATEPPDKQNWREKRLGSKVIWQCRGCGTWWGARHTVNCRFGG